MSKTNLFLSVVVCVLMVVILIDHFHHSKQMRRLNETMEKLSDRLETGVIVANDGGGNGSDDEENERGGSWEGPDPRLPRDPPPVNAGFDDPVRNGFHKLGEDFLLPPDDRFDPDRLRGTLREFGSTPKGLNSILENASTNSSIDAYVNDSLCERDDVDPARWRAGLATELVITDDFKTYTFKIRKGVRWHVPPIAYRAQYSWLNKEVELTAHDFVAYVEMIRNPDTECPQAKVYWEDLESIEALDDHTLRLRWKEKIYTSIASSMALEPLPRHVYLVDQNGKPYPEATVGVQFNKHWFDQAKQHIGVGPYRLTRFEPKVEMTFERNPDYWGATLHFSEIRWDLEVEEPLPMLTGFKNGDVHASVLTPQFYKTEILDRGEPRFAAADPDDPLAGRTGELGWEQFKRQAYSYIGWNMRRALFRDKRVRQAMTYAFPQERIIDEVYMGLGEPQHTNVHPDTPYANLDLDPYGYSLAKASQLLSEAGWEDTDGDGWRDKMIEGKRVPLAFVCKHYADSKEWTRTLDLFRESLGKIGVDMTSQPLEWPQLLKVYEDRDFEAVSGGWLMGFEVDFKQVWHSGEADKPKGSNHVGFKNERADEIAEALRSTFDIEERIRLAHEFQAIIHEQQPYTFFRSSEAIFIWQNLPSPGRDSLGGVVWGLEYLHPFNTRSHKNWYLRD